MKTATALSAPDRSCKPEVRELGASFAGKINDIRKNRSERFADFKSYHDICNAFHFNTEAAQSPISMPAAFFMPVGMSLISSVPCGALMRPLPQFQGGKQRGAELFAFLPNKIYY